MVTLVILIKSWVQNRVSTHAEDECQLYCDRLSSISINPRQTRWKSQSTTTSPLSTWTWPSFPWAYSLLGLRKLWRTASWTSAGLRQGTSHLNRTPTPTTMCYMNASRRCRSSPLRSKSLWKVYTTWRLAEIVSLSLLDELARDGTMAGAFLREPLDLVHQDIICRSKFNIS